MQFDAYSDYYDLLYQDKDYYREASYIESIINNYKPKSRRILELGCGTGKHARILADRGWQITGVERSETMLQRAQTFAKDRPLQNLGSFKAIAGDARNLRLNDTFDIVISLFHVMSYQTTNADATAMLTTAERHLEPGGVFVFDFWYGPAVLRELPSVRVKRMENDEVKVLRIAEPTLDTEHNTVNVQYTMQCTYKRSDKLVTVSENHLMRYFFLPELHLLAEKTNFSILASEEWLTGNHPSPSTWGVTVIATKN